MTVEFAPGKEGGQQIIYSCQDMRDFEVPYETDAFISIGDSMNYITANDDLCDVFKCVKKGLKQGGVFIFDLKTIHFFKDILADNTYAENREDSAALNNGLIKFPGVALFTSHDHQFIQTTANRIMEIVPSGQLIDKITTYDEYLESDEMARKRQGFAEAASDDED